MYTCISDNFIQVHKYFIQLHPNSTTSHPNSEFSPKFIQIQKITDLHSFGVVFGLITSGNTEET